jgi:photosystem II stability/assembly factor-like uncharacterized protein
MRKLLLSLKGTAGREPKFQELSMKSNRWWSLFGLALTLLALGGCATVPPPITTSQTLNGQEGAVVLKLITNGTSVGDPAEALSSITLKRELAAGEKPTALDTVVLSRTREMTNSTAVFSGLLAPGRYQISYASGFRFNISYTYPLNGYGTFEVKSQGVTLLGTLLVQPTVGNRFVLGHVPPEAELKRTFTTLFPTLAQQTLNQPISTFEPTAELARRGAAAQTFKQIETGVFNGTQLRADGNVLAGSKMGRVLWRKAGEKTWRSLDIDTWREVMSVRSYRGGLLAAGEEGLLRLSTDEGKTWEDLTPPAPGLIALAEPLPNGKVLALVRRNTSWQAFLSDNLQGGRWRSIGSFEQERSLNFPLQTAKIFANGEYSGVLMPNGEAQMFVAQSESIERRSTGVSVFDAHVTPNGLLVVQGGTLTQSTLISSDGGKTWRDMNTSRFVSAITFENATTAYAIAPIAPGIFPGAYGLMVSRDGAKTWKQAGVLPGQEASTETASLRVDPSDGSLLAFMRNGRLLRSADEGKTWTRAL